VTKTGPIGLRLEPDERLWLETLARTEQRSVASMARILVIEALKVRSGLGAPTKPKRRTK